MKKIILSGLVAGVILCALSILGLYLTIWFFPKLAEQYYSPAFNEQTSRYLMYYVHPFIIAMALSWFWSRSKDLFKGNFLTRGIEFGLLYTVIAAVPNMWLIYSALSVSLSMVGSWLLFSLLQGLVSGLVFEKMNP